MNSWVRMEDEKRRMNIISTFFLPQIRWFFFCSFQFSFYHKYIEDSFMIAPSSFSHPCQNEMVHLTHFFYHSFSIHLQNDSFSSFPNILFGFLIYHSFSIHSQNDSFSSLFNGLFGLLIRWINTSCEEAKKKILLMATCARSCIRIGSWKLEASQSWFDYSSAWSTMVEVLFKVKAFSSENLEYSWSFLHPSLVINFRKCLSKCQVRIWLKSQSINILLDLDTFSANLHQ